MPILGLFKFKENPAIQHNKQHTHILCYQIQKTI